jgi:hypothetical protein
LTADPQTVLDYVTPTASYSHTITSTTHTLNTVTLNTTSNQILQNRYVTISGSTTVPSIDGTYQVVSRTPTSITINARISTNGAGGTFTTATEDFRDCQACFNIITNLMNTDNGLFFSNYFESEGSVDQEGLITTINPVENELTVDYSLPFMQGAVTLYKSIPVEVIYAPQFFGDPSMTKQVSEGTMMFENSNYSGAIISCATDLSPFYEEIPFKGQGLGDFGQFPWSNQNWGGIGAPIPLRTYVPRQKQRCRFINIKFEHNAAFEKFSIYGISLTFRIVSNRGYR